jgi:redox-sensitive bicupin YhaK (pirin superfamily)
MTRSRKKPQHAICRAVRWVSKAQATQDGAGVSLFRAIGQPALRELDPFLLLDEMHSDQPEDYIAGFPLHPHRGFETLSYMVSGAMHHRDNQGNEGVVGSGGVQWMRTGRGIVHSEIPEQADGLLWGYQLWVNLPAAHKMDDPDYLDIGADALPTVALNDDGFIKVIAGRGIAETPGPVVRDDIDLVFLDVSLAPHSRLKQHLPAGHTVFAYVAEGQVEFGCGSFNSPATLGEREVAVFDDGNLVTAITDDLSARFLLIAGKPIGEPIVREGPFVMNTETEIATAIRDYQSGALA